jgi:hypothetical protein
MFELPALRNDLSRRFNVGLAARLVSSLLVDDRYFAALFLRLLHEIGDVDKKLAI